MSAMVLSSVKRFIEMSPKLEELGVQNIHFYNSQNGGDLNTPMIALVPFVDVVILGKDAGLSGHFNKVIDEAFTRRIPVLSEDCLYDMKNFCY
jgi:phosphopentomutase